MVMVGDVDSHGHGGVMVIMLMVNGDGASDGNGHGNGYSNGYCHGGEGHDDVCDGGHYSDE